MHTLRMVGGMQTMNKSSISRNKREGYYIGKCLTHHTRLQIDDIISHTWVPPKDINIYSHLQPMLILLVEKYIRNNILPDGINQLIDGSYEALCHCCDNYTPLYCDINEIPMTDYLHYCGGSPRCCP